MSIRLVGTFSLLLSAFVPFPSFGNERPRTKEYEIRVIRRDYAVKELLEPNGAFSSQQLINQIYNHITPESWITLGGIGMLDFYPENKTLVIEQTEAVHEEVTALLNLLRGFKRAEVSVEVQIVTLSASTMKTIYPQPFGFSCAFFPPDYEVPFQIQSMSDSDVKRVSRLIESGDPLSRRLVMPRRISSAGEKPFKLLLPRNKTGCDTDLLLTCTPVVSGGVGEGLALKVVVSGQSSKEEKRIPVSLRDRGVLESNCVSLLGGWSAKRRDVERDGEILVKHYSQGRLVKNVEIEDEKTFLLIKPHVTIPAPNRADPQVKQSKLRDK